MRLGELLALSILIEISKVLAAFIVLITTTTPLLGSPGPAPIALAAKGAAFGMERGLPFLTGILCGLSVTIIGAIAANKPVKFLFS